MYLRFVVKLYPTTGDGVWGSAVAQGDVYDVSVGRKLGDTNDTFSFKVNNIRNTRLAKTDSFDDLSAPFNSQDKVDIHLIVNGVSADSTNLLIVGLVKKVDQRVSTNGRVITISGISFSEVMTTGLTFVRQPSGNIMSFLEAALENIKAFNPNFPVAWDSDNPTYRESNPSLLDGDPTKAFPTQKGITEPYRSMSFLLDKYLQNEYTNDGRYYWFVNNSNKLVVRRRTNDTEGTILTEGSSFKTATYRINSDDVRNYIVVKCGLTPYNKPITARFDDVASRAKFGFKYYMIVDSKIASDLLEEQGFAANTKFPSGFPYTTTWDVSTSDDDDFDAQFRDEVERLGIIRGKTFGEAHNQGFQQLTLTMAPTVDFSVGENYKIISPSYDLDEKPFRLAGITWDIFSTVLMFKEEVAIA